MRILVIGDVVGDNGSEFLRRTLPSFKKNNGIDLCIVNGENSAQGNGIHPHSAEHLLASGADVITTGNHVLRRAEIYPKLDEEQESYNSLVSINHAHFVMVPTFIDNEERTGAVIEMLAYQGKQILTPAYFEKTLVGREMRDEDSEEMLYVIFDNRVYDVGLVYNVGNLKATLAACLTARQNVLSSQWNAYKKSAERSERKINEELAKISEQQ